MIAIFNSQSWATSAANKIHAYLLANRKDYNAEKWAVSNKSATEEKWAVKIPPDYPIELVTGESQIVKEMPQNWYEETV